MAQTIFAVVFWVVVLIVLPVWWGTHRDKRKQQREADAQQHAEARAQQQQVSHFEREVLPRHQADYERLAAHLNPIPPELPAAYNAFLTAAYAAPYSTDQLFDTTVMPAVFQAYAAYPVHDAVYLGAASWPEVIPSGIKDADRFMHCYVIGGTGTGKTTLLKHMILRDIAVGHGVTVLTPDKSFIINHLLPCLDPQRANDLIYFNPEDGERPVVFNPLDLQPHENIDRKADELLTLFKRSLGDTTPRMDAILRNSFYALLERKGSTLNDMYTLLDRSNPTLRTEVIQRTRDERTRQFFKETYASLPRDAALPIITRIDALTRASFLNNTLCQHTSTLNFADAMDQKRVVLCNLSDGAMGTNNATLLGQLLIAAIQQALFARDNQPEEYRVPHFLYIDEFEAYTSASTMALSDILTRARKLKLGITIAHQHLQQLPTELLAGILGNADRAVAFRISHRDAQVLAPEFNLNRNEPPFALRQELRKYASEVMSTGLWHPLPWLTELDTGQAWVRHKSQNTTHFITVPPDSHRRRPEQVAALVQASRQNFGHVPEPVASPPAAPQPVQPLAQEQKPAYNEETKKPPDDFLE